MKAKLEKRLEKLEAKKKTIEAKGVQINQQVRIWQQKYSDKMSEALMIDGAINEFKEMLTELNQPPPKATVKPQPQQEPAKSDKGTGTVKDQIGQGEGSA